MEMGHVEQGIVKTALLNKMPIPEKILNAPSVSEDNAFYFDAFFDLDTERDYSFGAGPIKWSSIKDYAVYHNLDEDQSNGSKSGKPGK